MNMFLRYPLAFIGVGIALLAALVWWLVPGGTFVSESTPAPQPTSTHTPLDTQTSEQFIAMVLEFERARLLGDPETRLEALAPFVTEHYIENYHSPLKDSPTTDVSIQIIPAQSIVTWEPSDSSNDVRYVTTIATIETKRGNQVINPAFKTEPFHTTWITTPEGWKVYEITEMR